MNQRRRHQSFNDKATNTLLKHTNTILIIEATILAALNHPFATALAAYWAAYHITTKHKNHQPHKKKQVKQWTTTPNTTGKTKTKPTTPSKPE